MRTLRLLLSTAVFAQVLIVSRAQQTPDLQERKETAGSAAARYFTDVVLLDQDGNPKRLYSDLIKGRTIIVNAFFTTCHDSCPIMTARMVQVQRALGEQLGKDVYILSLSVDPTQDTPAKLKAYGEQFKAKPGWFFLTGPKQDLEFALHKFGLLPGQKENHLDLFIIGNDRTGLWKKARGTAPAQEIIEVVNSVLNDHP